MPQLFGEKLRAARLRRGITQAHLAEQLGLASHAHVANLEAGRDVPSLSLVIRIGATLHISLEYLLRDTVPVDGMQADSAEATSTVQALPFGAKLRLFRLQRAWGQTELARRLGLARRSSIAHIENNSKAPSIDLLLKIADVFEVTLDQLLYDVDTKP